MSQNGDGAIFATKGDVFMGFTYEKDDIAEKLETFEWDNTWIDHPGDSTKKRILYIGDSISCATRYVATCQSDGKMAFDGYGTSKGLDNPYFQDSLKLFASQEGYRDVIIFNNGLPINPQKIQIIKRYRIIQTINSAK